MERCTFPLFALSLLTLVSCGSKADQKPRLPKMYTGCYEYVANKDTVRLLFEEKADSTCTGNLEYNLFEKDRNTGTISGRVEGRKITVDYAFMSEGVLSHRTIVLGKQTDALAIEGDGIVLTKCVSE